MTDKLMTTDRNITALHMGPTTIDRPVAGKIIPYEENGQMAAVVWFLVIDNQGQHLKRVNSAHVHIVNYEEITPI